LNKNLLTQKIKEKAFNLGFELFGITDSSSISDINRYNEWLKNGFAGDMDYLKRNIEKRENPESLLPGTKSIICLGLNYNQKIQFNDFKIAKYALGDDYHTFLKEKLTELFLYIKSICNDLEGRVYTDTAPILERSLAKRAGLGWIGKNTILINPQKGSYYLLGELFLNIELEYNEQSIKTLCGNCSRCIDSCPTDALVQPYELNSNLCISYLTIESKTEIPEEITDKMNNYIFGCDICQDVCPWNKKFSTYSKINDINPREWLSNKSLKEILEMEQEEFSVIFKNSPVKRTKLKGLIRNTIAMITKTKNIKYLDILKNIKNKHGDIVDKQIDIAIKNLNKLDFNEKSNNEL